MKTYITGASGRFPSSNSLSEFWDHLISGKDLVTSCEARFPLHHHGLPSRIGQINSPEKFDAAFFGVGKAQAACLDPQIRMLLEVVHEAIAEAGYTMADLAGSNTGVYVGGCFSDLHKALLKEFSTDAGTGRESVSGYENTGCCFAMFANRVSYCFDWTGPSVTVDTACSSSLVALDHACSDLLAGKITRAVVCGVSLITDPTISKSFQMYNMLSPSGTCHSFDDRADGYVRSDGVGAVLLEAVSSCSAEAALPLPGIMELLGCGTNSDGFKTQGK